MDDADSWLLSAFFSSAEAAFISLPKLRIRYLVESGVKGARQLAKAADRTERFLAAFLSVLGVERLLTHLRNRKAKATMLRDIKEEIMMNIVILDNSIRTTQQMRNGKGSCVGSSPQFLFPVAQTLYLATQGNLWEEKYKPGGYSLVWFTMSGIATYFIYRIKPGGRTREKWHNFRE